MLNALRRMKAQSTLEYAILIIIIVGALLTIQVYIKRGVQGRFKSSADDIGDQYSPGNTNVVKSTRTRVTTNELYGEPAGGQGESESRIIGNESTNTVEKSQILNTVQEYWGSDSETKK